MFYTFLLFIFFVASITYFRIADHFNIIDHPNERSSHTLITIRGGGIIFLFSIIICSVIYSQYWLIGLGTFIIGLVSFFDDILTLSNKLRILVHLIAVTLLFIALGVFDKFPFYTCVFLYFFVIGVINAYNFMDGINGITGLYSIVILVGLQWINIHQVNFIEPDMIWLPVLACFVFLFFNFRKKAKCFAGDVGSITIAFWILFLLLKVILQTNDWRYILFLSVYGVDSVLTVAHRLILRQNIFSPHRLHFYQLLANEHKIPHLFVATLYAAIQLLIIYFVTSNNFTLSVIFGIVLIPLILIYLVFKPRIMKA